MIWSSSAFMAAASSGVGCLFPAQHMERWKRGHARIYFPRLPGDLKRARSRVSAREVPWVSTGDLIASALQPGGDRGLSGTESYPADGLRHSTSPHEPDIPTLLVGLKSPGRISLIGHLVAHVLDDKWHRSWNEHVHDNREHGPGTHKREGNPRNHDRMLPPIPTRSTGQRGKSESHSETGGQHAGANRGPGRVPLRVHPKHPRQTKRNALTY
jgi:hypothetical protein